MQSILADRIYYEESGGGITLSGGEPVLQSGFASELFRQSKEAGLHTAIQTAGHYPYLLIEPLLPYTDMIIYDLKAISPKIYEEHIHADSSIILGNLEMLDHNFQGDLVVRTPCIGSVNDSEEEITAIVSWLTRLTRLKTYQLIPYHSLARSKYEAIGETFTELFYTPELAKLEELARHYLPSQTLKEVT